MNLRYILMVAGFSIITACTGTAPAWASFICHPSKDDPDLIKCVDPVRHQMYTVHLIPGPKYDEKGGDNARHKIR